MRGREVPVAKGTAKGPRKAARERMKIPNEGDVGEKILGNDQRL